MLELDSLTGHLLRVSRAYRFRSHFTYRRDDDRPYRLDSYGVGDTGGLWTSTHGTFMWEVYMAAMTGGPEVEISSGWQVVDTVRHGKKLTVTFLNGRCYTVRARPRWADDLD